MSRVISKFLFLVVFISTNASAFNLMFLKDSPIAEFDETDREMMLSTFYEALDNNEDDVISEWRNEETGHYGMVKPFSTEESDGVLCRSVNIQNHVNDDSGNSTFKFCKDEQGKWKIAEQES